jgi:hypothetical protein
MNETLEQMKKRIAYRVEHEAGFQRSAWDLQLSLDKITKDWWCFIHYVPSPHSHCGKADCEIYDANGDSRWKGSYIVD